ncbi:MAG: PP2C family protein-serine/threonine phosphatase [Desulforhabdus sp.]|jgi:sigma-B regulation protein RsbU (phosphoserine phosphatase)|nr:PP2C family protein-serine/threonine phosphatase [Desulforhabdus sp.]
MDKLNPLVKELFGPGNIGHLDPEVCMQKLLEYRAWETDNEINKQLLKQLVLKYSAAERELVRLNSELLDKQRRLDQDLKAAAGIQHALLPVTLPETNNLQVAWKFIPCEQIGGDIFNVFPLDSDHVALYMLDVSGHGVPSALVTVSVSQALQPDGGYVLKKHGSGQSVDRIVSPKELLAALDEQYPLERFDMFFSMIYGIVNIRQGYLIHANAGHPPAILLNPERGVEVIDADGPIIGMGGIPFEEARTEIARGDKVLFYTDGIIEYENPREGFYGKERFYDLLQESKRQPITAIMDKIIDSVLEFGDHTPPQDDISLLGFEYMGEQ